MRHRIRSCREPSRAARHPAVRLASALAAGLLLAGALTGCTADQDGEAAPGSTEATPGVPALELRVEVTRVSGKLAAARRAHVAAGIHRVLAAYVRAAYLHPDGPDARIGGATRSRRQGGTAVGGPFAGFTPGAARQARGDRSLLTSAGFGDAADVRALPSTASVSVLAPRGRLVGATAGTTLRFAVTGADGSTRRREVHGRVLLTPRPGGWRIFGYELATGPVATEAR